MIGIFHDIVRVLFDVIKKLGLVKYGLVIILVFVVVGVGFDGWMVVFLSDVSVVFVVFDGV